MSGHLIVVGLGPGDPRYLTPDAEDALAAAEAIYGYGPYLDRVPVRAGQNRHASNNREERARATAALRHAAQGARVAVVSGGDPGVFAMAAAICEAIEAGPESWRALDRSGRLPRAIYVERGTMADAKMIPLTAKPDDDAPYFAVVLVPGWAGRPGEKP